MGVTSFKGDIYWSQCRARSFALKVQPVCCSFPSSTQDFWTGGPSPSATSRTGTRAGRPWSGWSQETNRGSSWCSNCRTSGWSASRRRSAALRCKDFASTRMTMTAMRTFRSRRQRLSRDIRCRGSRELRVRPVEKTTIVYYNVLHYLLFDSLVSIDDVYRATSDFIRTEIPPR